MLEEVQLPLVPVYGKLVGYVDILDDVHFEIDFTINSWPVGDWGSIFQCGTANEVRYPGLFIHPDSGVDGAVWEGLYIVVTGVGIMSDHLQLDVNYHVEIDFTQSWWTVVVNGETIRDGESKSSHTVTQSMPCYSGFPHVGAADVTITALLMSTTGTMFPTNNPTPSPTSAPTDDPSPAPTGHPTPAPTRYPTAHLDGHVLSPADYDNLDGVSVQFGAQCRVFLFLIMIQSQSHCLPP